MQCELAIDSMHYVVVYWQWCSGNFGIKGTLIFIPSVPLPSRPSLLRSLTSFSSLPIPKPFLPLPPLPNYG